MVRRCGWSEWRDAGAVLEAINQADAVPRRAGSNCRNRDSTIRYNIMLGTRYRCESARNEQSDQVTERGADRSAMNGGDA